MSFVGTSTRTIARRSPRPAPLQPRHAAAPQHELVAWLRPGGTIEVLVTVERLERDRSCRATPGRSRPAPSVTRSSSVAAVPVVRSHAQVHVQVAGRPAARAGGTSPGQPQRRAVDHAGRHVDVVGLVGRHPALTTTRRARRGDHLTQTAAARARARSTPSDRARSGAPGGPGRSRRTREHVTGLVPSPAPEPSQVSHRCGNFSSTGI